MYHGRGLTYVNLGDTIAAIDDYTQAADLYLQQGMAAGYRAVLNDMAQL
ncbi:MAG: hypothetical protein QNJ46_02925 [Leptolyngbyaceae cyanobacterium MO_188.B28]|nr:hypothetical protein [Leptolyngbyaceae cyanobacterium MO_188.B28]